MKINDQSTYDLILKLITLSKFDERQKFQLSEISDINSVVINFDLFLQEKWRVAYHLPGSGNTKNIGSIKSIVDLKQGNGPFTKYRNGEEVFDDYWMYYQTKAMAGDGKPPYSNLDEYVDYKNIKPQLL